MELPATDAVNPAGPIGDHDAPVAPLLQALLGLAVLGLALRPALVAR